jgi:hypothetical protein
MSDLEAVIKLGQRCLEAAPAIILGSGASIAHGVRGMQQLQDYLVEHVRPDNSIDEDIWERFK